MRFAIDGLPLAAALTGVGRYTLELSKALAEISADDSFTLISPSPLIGPVELDIAELSARNLSEVILDYRLLRRFWWSFGLPLYLVGSKFDLFHGTNFEIPRWNVFPSVVTIHDLSTILFPDTHRTPLAERARKRLPRVAQSAQFVITPSESVKREVCEHLGVAAEKVVVTPEAPRSSFTRIEPEESAEVLRQLNIEQEFILFVGTIEPRKNLLNLARAYTEVLQHHTRAPQLVIAGGEGWLMTDFYEYVRSQQLEDRIRFTGYLPDQPLRALYSACAVFVYPSLYEGFGLPPLEAMACGAPVIVSDIPVLRESVGSAGRFVDPKDPSSIAHEMMAVVCDKQMADKLSLLGMKQASKFSWKRTAELTLEVYREVAARQRRPSSTVRVV